VKIMLVASTCGSSSSAKAACFNVVVVAEASCFLLPTSNLQPPTSNLQPPTSNVPQLQIKYISSRSESINPTQVRKSCDSAKMEDKRWEMALGVLFRPDDGRCGRDAVTRTLSVKEDVLGVARQPRLGNDLFFPSTSISISISISISVPSSFISIL